MPDGAREQRLAAFKDLNRRGFSEDDLEDPNIREGFSIGAGALVLARDHLADYLVVLARLQSDDDDLEQVFSTDLQVFQSLFTVMYGEKE